MSINSGEAAPDFELDADDGTRVKLSSLLGQRVLIVFYPGDETPVCTAQLCEYSEGLEEFTGLNCRVLAISADDLASHRAFRAKKSLGFPLLADTDLAVAKAYGVKGMLGMKRACFLVDEKGVVRYAHVESIALFRRRRAELISALEAMAQ